jgi:hypothetical protein
MDHPPEFVLLPTDRKEQQHAATLLAQEQNERVWVGKPFYALRN